MSNQEIVQGWMALPAEDRMLALQEDPGLARAIGVELGLLLEENERLRVQALAALRPSEPLEWHRDDWAMVAAPEHPRRSRLDVEILFEGEWTSREEDEEEIDDGEEGHSGKVEWLRCQLSTTSPEGLKPVVIFRLHVSDCLRLYPCASCAGRGEVEYETGVEGAGQREVGVAPCPVCYGEGADLMAEAGEVLQAVYWSWLRSAGRGGGAEPLPASPAEAPVPLAVEGRCTCDDFCDDPCPHHGWGQMECACGERVRAPLVVRAGWPLVCPDCGRVYVGVEDGSHGHWEAQP